MTNFDKLLFSPNWIKICKETMNDFQDSKVVLLHFGKKGVNMLGFNGYLCDSCDLIALRTKDIAHYFMPLEIFDQLYLSILGEKTFSDEFQEILNTEGKNGLIKNGIGIRETPFLSTTTFELKDSRDLTAMSKLEGMLWR